MAAGNNAQTLALICLACCLSGGRSPWPPDQLTKERDPKDLTLYDDLSLSYIYDPVRDPDDHRELMTGTPATWYDVRRNLDRLPSFVDPEQTGMLRSSEKGRLVRWLEKRLKERIAP